MDRRLFLRNVALAVVGGIFAPKYGRWFRPTPNSCGLGVIGGMNVLPHPREVWRAPIVTYYGEGFRIEHVDMQWVQWSAKGYV